MSKVSFISPEGLRLDGRRAGEIRRIFCEMGVVPGTDGSAVYQHGNSRVLCSVVGPLECRKRSQALHNKAVVTVHLSVANFSRPERKSFNKNDRVVKDFSAFLRQTFESAILIDLFPRSEIIISVQVLQVDGSIGAACVNAASLALVDAGVPMVDFVVACNAGLIDKTPVVDLNHTERSARGGEVLVAVLPSAVASVDLASRAALPAVLSMDLESGSVAADSLAPLVELAIGGALRIHSALAEAIAASASAKHKTA